MDARTTVAGRLLIKRTRRNTRHRHTHAHAHAPESQNVTNEKHKNKTKAEQRAKAKQLCNWDKGQQKGNFEKGTRALLFGRCLPSPHSGTLVHEVNQT